MLENVDGVVALGGNILLVPVSSWICVDVRAISIIHDVMMSHFRPGYMIPEEYANRMGRNFHYLSPMAGQTLVTQRLSSSEVRLSVCDGSAASTEN